MTRRPEIEVLAVVDPVQLQTVASRVHLKIEDARFHRLLIRIGQAVERGGEGVGYEEVHRATIARVSGGRSVKKSLERNAGLRVLPQLPTAGVAVFDNTSGRTWA